jgi:hypothetical protein
MGNISGRTEIFPTLSRDSSVIFMFAPCINSIKTLFIFPTDAHYYKIVEMLKQFKRL